MSYNERESEKLLSDIKICQAVVCVFARQIVDAKNAKERQGLIELIASSLRKVDAAEEAYTAYLQRDAGTTTQARP